MASSDAILRVNDLILNKKILSLREHYDISDANGTKLGEADGNLFQMPAKFQVTDTNGSQLMRLEGKIFSLRNQFIFRDNQGTELGTIQKKILKLVGEEYYVEKAGTEIMRIYGNFTEHDYKFEINGAQVASLHRKWVAVRDTLEISITGEADHRIIIGSVILIEHIEVTERQRHQ